MPLIPPHDDALSSAIEGWRGWDSTKQKGGKKTGKTAADVLIAPHPGNAYPGFKRFQKASGITRQRLVESMGLLGEADAMLKSSRQSGDVILEWTVIKILNLFKKQI